jgi:arylsulfatase A-like enzyme
MRIKKVSFAIIILGVFATCAPVDQEATESQPNIIFILTDDLGYGDLGVLYQNDRDREGKFAHKTPNLDKMAGEGTLLTRHYVPAPVCAPSRASLMLGVHQGHANVRDNQFDKALEDNHTIATVLKEAGYTTGIVGKYGLQGKEGNSPETWPAYPTRRGFDFFFGYVRHVDGHNHYPAHEALKRPPMELYYGDQEISSQLEGAYTTDLFTAAAKKWITDVKQEKPEQPFFLYLAYNTPHAGLQVAPTPYPDGGGLNGGVQWIGEDGNFINAIGDTIDNYIHPDYNDKDWPETQKRFASMVRRIDNAVADVRQLLQDLNIAENTMIVFSSDNGPHHESYGYGDYDPTFFDSYGEMDGVKRDTWEGGIRVPTFAWWPGKIIAGARDDIPSQFHDWLPTFAAIAGIPAPARTDGVSLLPQLINEGGMDSSTVYVEYENNGSTPDYDEFDPSHAGETRKQMQVIYLDGLKGVRYNIQSHQDDFRIYNTKNDTRELQNLAEDGNYALLQQRMKNEVLRLRRTNQSAIRPYDSLPIPAYSNFETLPGLQYEVYNVAVPWVPVINSLDEELVEAGTTDGFGNLDLSAKENWVVDYKGYLKVPATGSYTFIFKNNGKAIMRLHKALVVDADKNYTSGEEITTQLMLEEGLHPIHLIYSGSGSPDIELQWIGPQFERVEVSVENLLHAEE